MEILIKLISEGNFYCKKSTSDATDIILYPFLIEINTQLLEFAGRSFTCSTWSASCISGTSQIPWVQPEPAVDFLYPHCPAVGRRRPTFKLWVSNTAYKTKENRKKKKDAFARHSKDTFYTLQHTFKQHMQDFSLPEGWHNHNHTTQAGPSQLSSWYTRWRTTWSFHCLATKTLTLPVCLHSLITGLLSCGLHLNSTETLACQQAAGTQQNSYLCSVVKTVHSLVFRTNKSMLYTDLSLIRPCITAHCWRQTFILQFWFTRQSNSKAIYWSKTRGILRLYI